MRHILVVFFSIASIFPAIALGAQTGTPCDFVDREALIALKLTEPKTTMTHQEIPGAKQGVNTCTITPHGQSLPSLSVTAVKLPAEAKAVKPLCNGQPINAMEVVTCVATIQDTYVSFTMLGKSASDSKMKTVLASQVDRLFKRGSVLGSSGTPRQ